MPCVVRSIDIGSAVDEGSGVLREAIDVPRLLRPGRNDSWPMCSRRKFKKCCYET